MVMRVYNFYYNNLPISLAMWISIFGNTYEYEHRYLTHFQNRYGGVKFIRITMFSKNK